LQARQAKAEALMAQSDLAAALIQWQILNALDPENTTFHQKRQTTQALIEQRVQTHLQLGKKAFKQGHLKRAKRTFLRVLALDPSQPLPPTYLRQIEQRHLKQLQRNKLTRMQDRAADAPTPYDRSELEQVRS
jgi:tetratricopeptide (TPR) repeat protein